MTCIQDQGVEYSYHPGSPVSLHGCLAHPYIESSKIFRNMLVQKVMETLLLLLKKFQRCIVKTCALFRGLQSSSTQKIFRYFHYNISLQTCVVVTITSLLLWNGRIRSFLETMSIKFKSNPNLNKESTKLHFCCILVDCLLPFASLSDWLRDIK